MQGQKIYYHFTGDKLRDGRPVPAIGEWLVFDGDPIPCKCGLHACPDAFDALWCAPGSTLHKVVLGGKIVERGSLVNKVASQKRKIVASIDAEPIMRLFARRVALDVVHLWGASQVVREYLETGDESKRDAAWDAANAAAREAAGAAARGAAWAAAWAAANAVAWDTAGAAAGAAAKAAAWDAAWDAKQTLYRGWFNEMVESAFAMQEVR